MHFACEEAARLGFNSIILEGGCLTVIKAVRLTGQGPWEIDLTIADIRNSLSRFQEARVNHVFREAKSSSGQGGGSSSSPLMSLDYGPSGGQFPRSKGHHWVVVKVS